VTAWNPHAAPTHSTSSASTLRPSPAGARRPQAITGFENQVSRLDESTGEEVVVPCTELYNHHWNLYLASSERPFSDADRKAQLGKHGWAHVDKAMP
jgi:hypothetical protein